MICVYMQIIENSLVEYFHTNYGPNMQNIHYAIKCAFCDVISTLAMSNSLLLSGKCKRHLRKSLKNIGRNRFQKSSWMTFAIVKSNKFHITSLLMTSQKTHFIQ